MKAPSSRTRRQRKRRCSISININPHARPTRGLSDVYLVSLSWVSHSQSYKFVLLFGVILGIDVFAFTALAVDRVVSTRSWLACFTSCTDCWVRSPRVLPVSLTFETAC